LRAWIARGIDRMEMEGRLTPEDLAIVHANLKNFIQLAKIEFEGHCVNDDGPGCATCDRRVNSVAQFGMGRILAGFFVHVIYPRK
jgi:hypothetical protein